MAILQHTLGVFQVLRVVSRNRIIPRVIYRFICGFFGLSFFLLIDVISESSIANYSDS